MPTKLSQTGIFRNTRTMLAPSSLVPYEIHSPLRSDAASKHRWSYIPAGSTATIADPVGTSVVEGWINAMPAQH